ncbi:hypothetical protein K435DRAFT_588559, partial [Dendrothele bispora CBS 962.96]
MVGCGLLADVSDALSKATGINDLFGGINVIFAGDFTQLPPVLCSRLYSRVNRFCAGTNSGQKDIFGRLAWLSVDTVVCLTQVQRSSGDQRFTELLHRLRTGSCTDEDYDLLRTRLACRVRPDWTSSKWNAAPMIVTENAIKDAVNTHAVHAYAQRANKPIHWYYAT